MQAKDVEHPQYSTLQKCFERMVERRMEENRSNENGTGLSENHGDLEKMLDKMIAEMAQKKEDGPVAEEQEG